MLTGFNILNRRPHTKSIAGTCALLQFQCLYPIDPNSSSCVILSVRTCTAPHTSRCSLLNLGGLVAHGFQHFEQKTPYTIDSRYLFPSPVSMLSPNGPKRNHLRHFFRLEPALPHTHAHAAYWTLEVWLLTGFTFLNRRPRTQSIAGTYALLQFQC